LPDRKYDNLVIFKGFFMKNVMLTICVIAFIAGVAYADGDVGDLFAQSNKLKVDNTAGLSQKIVEKDYSNFKISEEELYHKIYGALYGKCIGILLAQPFEGLPREEIKKRASKHDAYPIEYYLPNGVEVSWDGLQAYLVGNFKKPGYPANDDTTLMFTALVALREHGFDFTPKNIAEAWIEYVPSAATAEAVALENYKKGLWPPESAIRNNPYREWIGSQMRTDIWGLVSPGMPKVAAELAKRDSITTHVGNGVYGGQYAAALTSLAFCEPDMVTLLEQSLLVIPQHSEYAWAIRDVISWYKKGYTWDQSWQLLDDRYGWNADGTRVNHQWHEKEYNSGAKHYAWRNTRWVHVVPNGAAVALSLLYGEGDFSKTVCLATMAGYDNDCNAGTVGAVIGTRIGAGNIPEKWKEPIRNIMAPGTKAMASREKISDVSREITDFAKQNLERNKR
jgi:ADP-ribosylglycohydrolase